jgi:hypothetical protein
MYRRAWLWSPVAVLPLLAVGAWFGLRAANVEAPAQTESASLTTCCTPDCCPPDCCPGCCEVGQAAKNNPVAKTDEQAKVAVFICPLTGEQLPCPQCCPLNQQTVQASAKNLSCPPCPWCP